MNVSCPTLVGIVGIFPSQNESITLEYKTSP